MSGMEIRIESEYRLVIGSKKVSMTRAELIALRDQLTAVIGGQAVPDPPGAQATDGLREWTAEEDERLLALIQRGKPFGFVAHELGRSEGAVRQRQLKLRQRVGNGVPA